MTKAFTLIELLIVIAIIAILALIAIPNFADARVRANYARVQADMRSLATALETYYVDHNAYPLNGHGNLDYPRTYSNFMNVHYTPAPGTSLDQYCVFSLTTPISYITSFPVDPFALQRLDNITWGLENPSYYYTNFVSAARRYESGQLDDCGAKYDGWVEPIEAPTPMHLNGPDGPIIHVNWIMISGGPMRNSRVASGHGGISLNYAILLCGKGSSADSSDNYYQLRQGYLWPYDPTNGTNSEGLVFRTNVTAQ